MQSLITMELPGVGALQPILSLILPLTGFSASGGAGLRVKLCWMLAPWGWACCLSGEGVHMAEQPLGLL